LKCVGCTNTRSSDLRKGRNSTFVVSEQHKVRSTISCKIDSWSCLSQGPQNLSVWFNQALGSVASYRAIAEQRKFRQKRVASCNLPNLTTSIEIVIVPLYFLLCYSPFFVRFFLSWRLLESFRYDFLLPSTHWKTHLFVHECPPCRW